MPRTPIDLAPNPAPPVGEPTTGSTTQLSLRLPTGLVDRADALVAPLGSSPPPGVTRVTRTLVLRLALERGLASLEDDQRSGNRGSAFVPGRP